MKSAKKRPEQILIRLPSWIKWLVSSAFIFMSYIYESEHSKSDQ